MSEANRNPFGNPFGAARALLMVLMVWSAAAEVAARGSEINPGMWLVALDDPPSLEFRGGMRMTVTAGGGAVPRFYARTAPTADRPFRVRSPAVKQYAAHLDARRAALLATAEQRIGRELKPRFVYRHLANGFAIALDAREAAMLRGLDGVRSVQPDRIQYVHTDAGPGWIGAPAVWSGTGGASSRGEGTVLGVIDTGVNWESSFFDVSAPGAPPVSNPRGQQFGLCNDTALDIPCTDKLIGVYDFTDEDTNGFDPDGHGSHVASTAVGLPLSFNIDLDGGGPLPSIFFSTSGVAPRASFISYKACQAPPDGDIGNFQCSGSATSAALEQALTDGVDVVNFSIGGPAFDPWAPFGNQARFRNLRAAGIVPVLSAGNSGPGDFSVNSPANTPWVVAVANATHGRILGTRLVGTSGGAFALGELVGESLSPPLSTSRPVVHASEFGNALCGTGPAELQPTCGGNTGASNPFAPGTFNGEIVVCDRGVYGRVEKGKNLQLAGAGGMILANTEAQGESTNADEHCLPSMHVGAADGDRLRDWLNAGDGHRGRLTGTAAETVEARAGRLATSSSRGPAVDAPGVMKPNVTAPGTNILAAASQTDAEGTGPGADAANQLAFLTGTSMSSPHVAGAALLLRSLNPGWSVSDVISALETTADAGIVSLDDGTQARIIDRGAGGVQVDRAARAGLSLPVSESDFINANPAVGGDPSALNLPGIVSEECSGQCSFQRTLRALEAGNWQVSTQGSLAISVAPTSLSLSAGQQTTLQIDVAAGATTIGSWGQGSVVLTPSDPDLATQRLPVGAFFSAGQPPERQSFTSTTNRSRAEITIPNLAEIPELTFRTSALETPEARTSALPQDPSNDDPFDSDDGALTELVDVGPDTLLFQARTLASEAPDIDLFIGRDTNGDGRGSFAELECESISPEEIEECGIENPLPGTWWIVVQNWDASSSFGSDNVDWEFAVLEERTEPTSLAVVGPGFHPGGPLSVPVYWDQPDMRRDERRVGAIAMATTPDFVANIGVTPIEVTRTGANSPADKALFEGRTEQVAIPAGTRHGKLYIDIPASATALDVDILGDNVEANLAFLEFGALESTIPLTPDAPDNFIAGSQAIAGGRRITLQAAGGDTLDAGRYFVVLDNTAGSERVYEITATVSETAPADSFRGLWGPATRSIRQGIDWQIGGGGEFAVWYTYDEAGVPTFYITEVVEPPAEARSFFSAPVFRVTSNGVRNTRTPVGEVQVTRLEQNSLMYAWRLLGNHGSEIYDAQVNRRCPVIDGAPSPRTGHWTSPETSEGGLTWLITDTAEAFIRYYYDAGNEPRWVLADPELPPTLPDDASRMEVRDFRGWCIYCEETAISFEAVGTLERQFVDAQTVREVSDFVSGPPLDVSVQNDRLMNRVTSTPACTNP